MKYQDFNTPNEKEYSLMKQNYEKMQAQENEDLQELLNKMNNQLTRLKENNENGKYDDVISKLASSINELSSLIATNQSQFLRKIQKLQGKNNLPPFWHIHQLDEGKNNSETNKNSTIDNSSPSADSNTNSTIDNNDLSANTNNSSEDISNDNLQTSDTENIEGENAPNIDTSTGRNTTKRNSPMPGNRLFNAFKSLNVNLTNNLNRLFGAKSHTSCIQHTPPIFPPQQCEPPHHPHKYQPPHKPPIKDFDDRCEFGEVCKHHQIDIIRLFLLYMMLRPTCKYLPTITAIANTQLDILLQLL